MRISDDDMNPLAEPSSSDSSFSISVRQRRMTLFLLFLVNLLNYMDRYTLAGIPDIVQKYFDINNRQFGQLQTLFFVSYMLASPIFGYLGDRICRKYLVIFGISFWSIVTLLSSFISQKVSSVSHACISLKYFSLFSFMRCLVGVGEASYSTIAPTVIADMYIDNRRTLALGVFFFAVPVGRSVFPPVTMTVFLSSGLGYIIGSRAALISSDWRWALRLTPILGLVALLLILILYKDPPRGRADHGTHLKATSMKVDLISLVRSKTFCFITLMFTCVCFVLGALTWWAVALLEDSVFAGDSHSTAVKNIPILFGATVCTAGLFGVVLGTQLARVFRPKYPKSDILVCVFGQFMAAPILFLALALPSYSFWASVVLTFCAQLAMCLQFALVSDITMSVTIPTRRATANAFQTLLSHLLGDAISPEIIGKVSDEIRTSNSYEGRFYSLQNALYITPFIVLLGGVFAMLASRHVLKDKLSVQQTIRAARVSVMEITEDAGDQEEPRRDR